MKPKKTQNYTKKEISELAKELRHLRQSSKNQKIKNTELSSKQNEDSKVIESNLSGSQQYDNSYIRKTPSLKNKNLNNLNNKKSIQQRIDSNLNNLTYENVTKSSNQKENKGKENDVMKDVNKIKICGNKKNVITCSGMDCLRLFDISQIEFSKIYKPIDELDSQDEFENNGNSNEDEESEDIKDKKKEKIKKNKEESEEENENDDVKDLENEEEDDEGEEEDDDEEINEIEDDIEEEEEFEEKNMKENIQNMTKYEFQKNEEQKN